MSTVSDMKADMVILSALIRDGGRTTAIATSRRSRATPIWDGGRATAIATSRIPYVPISSA